MTNEGETGQNTFGEEINNELEKKEENETGERERVFFSVWEVVEEKGSSSSFFFRHLIVSSTHSNIWFWFFWSSATLWAEVTREIGRPFLESELLIIDTETSSKSKKVYMTKKE